MLMANCHDVAPTRICHKARLPGQEGGTEKCPLQEGAPPQSPAPVALAVKQRNNALACRLIALRVIQLLGVRSLVGFGDTCLFHSVVILREVQRRGGVIATIKAKVAWLIASTGNAKPTCDNFVTAMKLVDQGWRLIDNKVKIYKKICTNELCCDDGDGH